MREWTTQHDVARVENAGVDNAARCGKGGQCRSGQFGTIWQGWTLQEWTNRHDEARVDIAGVDNVAPLWQRWTMQEWSVVTKAVYKITSLANHSLLSELTRA